METNLTELESRIGYSFKDKTLLVKALTHSSYANEKKLGKGGCNERLEFLGDAVLELISSHFLFEKYPKLPEGELTKKRASLVCEPSLAFCARDFELPKYLLLGRGEELTGGRNRDSIVSDATEALLGAIYDSKTILQEIVQENLSHGVEYRLVGESGPDHNKSFTVEVLVNDQVMGQGTGHTKKAAEQAAAYEAIRKLRK